MIILGNVTGSIGQTSSDCETLTNIKQIIYDYVSKQPVPQIVLNTIAPIGFNRPHKWVVGQIFCLSENYHAFYHNGTSNTQYIKQSGSNVTVPYAVFSQTTTGSGGGKVVFTFTGFVPVDEPWQIQEGQEVVTVYPFVSQYVTKTWPT